MRNYLIAFLLVLACSCGLNSATVKSPKGVRISNITENQTYPAKVEDAMIGEVEFIDKNGPNKAITGITEDGARCDTDFPMAALH